MLFQSVLNMFLFCKRCRRHFVDSLAAGTAYEWAELKSFKKCQPAPRGLTEIKCPLFCCCHFTGWNEVENNGMTLGNPSNSIQIPLKTLYSPGTVLVLSRVICFIMPYIPGEGIVLQALFLILSLLQLVYNTEGFGWNKYIFVSYLPLVSSGTFLLFGWRMLLVSGGHLSVVISSPSLFSSRQLFWQVSGGFFTQHVDGEAKFRRAERQY